VPELSLGNVFAHRFEIEKRVRSGGMGLIYRARDRLTGRPVALKLLLREANSDELDRFMREARTLSELRHPGIVAYVGHGISSDGQPYLAMEWLEGEDLASRLRRQGPSVGEVVTLLHRAADALAVAHQAGVLHRDLKPSNLFLREGLVERVTLIDFGLARRVLGGAQVTNTGVVVGTPEYMVPEQARGDRQIGPSADVFSLGCVAFECLTGQPPFVSEHIASVLAKILFEEAPPLTAARPNLPESLSKLVGRMLVKSPLARIPDAAALRTELQTLGDIPEAAIEARPPSLDCRIYRMSSRRET
jgi:serine/threonine protein kinase